MDINTFFNSDASINGYRAKKHESYIVQNYAKDIDHLKPSLATRIKYEKYSPSSIYCNCGKPLKFSPHKGEVFTKTCGSMQCVPKSYDKSKAVKKFKETLKTNKDHINSYSNREMREYILSLIDQGINVNYFTTLNNDVSKYLKFIAKQKGYSSSQLCHHVIHELDSIPECIHGKQYQYLSFEKGYTKTNRCCSSAPISRAINKINEKKSQIEVEGKFEILEYYPINKNPWKLQCKECNHEFDVWLRDGKDTTTINCEKCSPRNKSSYEFKLIEEITKFYQGDIIHTYRLENSKNKNGYKSIDIYIPEFKLGIELNGMYWHSDDAIRHNIKRNLCTDLGIELIQFTDIDIDNKFDIVLSMIKNKIRINTKIHARKCHIKPITVDDYRLFCNENHIKGYSSAFLKLGMYHDNKLVSIISVSKSRFEKNAYEIIRFCTLRNHTVIGGLSKFLKYIERNYDFSELITYADLHYGTGDSYFSVGMEKIGHTQPGYIYYDGVRCYSRHKFQKKALKTLYPALYEDSMTEQEIMYKAGYSRYYDCGNLKFRYSFKNCSQSH